MKFKKYMCAFVACLFVLVGCSSSKGAVKDLTVKELTTKLENKESFVVTFSLTTCPYCITFKEMLDGYLKNNDLTVYDVVLDKEADVNVAVEQVEGKFPAFSGTPDVYFVENGVIKSRLWDELQPGEGFSEPNFDNWVKKYELLNLNAKK